MPLIAIYSLHLTHYPLYHSNNQVMRKNRGNISNMTHTGSFLLFEACLSTSSIAIGTVDVFRFELIPNASGSHHSRLDSGPHSQIAHLYVPMVPRTSFIPLSSFTLRGKRVLLEEGSIWEGSLLQLRRFSALSQYFQRGLWRACSSETQAEGWAMVF